MFEPAASLRSGDIPRISDVVNAQMLMENAVAAKSDDTFRTEVVVMVCYRQPGTASSLSMVLTVSCGSIKSICRHHSPLHSSNAQRTEHAIL